MDSGKKQYPSSQSSLFNDVHSNNGNTHFENKVIEEARRKLTTNNFSLLSDLDFTPTKNRPRGEPSVISITGSNGRTPPNHLDSLLNSAKKNCSLNNVFDLVSPNSQNQEEEKAKQEMMRFKHDQREELQQILGELMQEKKLSKRKFASMILSIIRDNPDAPKD